MRSGSAVLSNSLVHCARHYRAETKGSFLLGLVFAKGCKFLLVSLGQGLGSGSGRWWGWSSCGKQGKRGRGWGGWGVGWGPTKEPASQCASFVETTL